jgi:hypothetical protein
MTPNLELKQSAAVAFEEPIQEKATRGVGERFENSVVVHA